MAVPGHEERGNHRKDTRLVEGPQDTGNRLIMGPEDCGSRIDLDTVTSGAPVVELQTRAVRRSSDTRADTSGDTVATPSGTSTATSHRTGHRDVLPSWCRDREAFTGLVLQRADEAWRMAAFHTVRIPKYWATLATRSPIGLGRVVRWVWDWSTDATGRTVRRSVAYTASMGAQEATAFHRVSEQHWQRMKFRCGTVAFGTLAAGWGAHHLATGAPGPALVAETAVGLAALGMLGRHPDRPVVDSFAVADTGVPRLTTDLIVAALASLSLAGLNKALREDPSGGVRFLAPGVHRDGPGWRADVDLPPGVTVEDIVKRRDRLASGLRRPVGCVWPGPDIDAHAGRLVLWVGDKPLAKTKPKPWPLAVRGRSDIFTGQPFGIDQRGQWVPINLMFASMAIGSIPRMGKTFALRVIACIGALDPRVQLNVFELKGTGDLDDFEAVSHRHRCGYDPEDIAYGLDAIRELHKDMGMRAKTIRSLPRAACPEKKVTPELADRKDLGLRPVLVLIDECQVWFEDPEHGKEFEELVTDLIKRGPALGLTVVLATQRPDAKSLPTGIRGNLALRFCLKVMGHTENDMVLGTGMNSAGIQATAFSRAETGVGYLAGEADDPLICRTAYLPDATGIVTRARTMRETAGTITGHAAGLDTTPHGADPAPTLLDDLAAVMPHGENRAWSETLLARLVEHRPDAYHGWTTSDLGNALGAYGITTIQIGRRLNGGKVTNRKGITRDTLTTALTQRGERLSA